MDLITFLTWFTALMEETVEFRSRLNAAVLLQRKVFEEQCERLEVILSEYSAVPPTISTSIPAILTRRNFIDDHRRIADDFELTLLGLVDSNGLISLNSHLQEFMIAMTRISKVLIPFFLFVCDCILFVSEFSDGQ